MAGNNNAAKGPRVRVVENKLPLIPPTTKLTLYELPGKTKGVRVVEKVAVFIASALGMTAPLAKRMVWSKPRSLKKAETTYSNGFYFPYLCV